jgi:hypothetical protein
MKNPISIILVIVVLFFSCRRQYEHQYYVSHFGMHKREQVKEWDTIISRWKNQPKKYTAMVFTCYRPDCEWIDTFYLKR